MNESPDHGGDIQGFCHQHGFTQDQVLDLSTGISPWSWPAPEVPQSVWQRLPYGGSDQSELLEAASIYYQCSVKNLLPAAGSQLAIEALPRIAETGSEVMIPELGYAEHGFRWQKSGHRLNSYSTLKDLKSQLENSRAKYAVVINPNNPGSDQYAVESLLPLAQMLGERGGFLVIDEAFADAVPELSLMPYANQQPLIILRSVGKFFGLAGLRLGFAAAPELLINKLNSEVGLWSVSGAAHWLGTRMLADYLWIEEQRKRLKDESTGLLALLKKQISEINWKKSTTFISGFGSNEKIASLEADFAQSGIYVRTFKGDRAIIRLGLIAESDLKRLQCALEKME